MQEIFIQNNRSGCKLLLVVHVGINGHEVSCYSTLVLSSHFSCWISPLRLLFTNTWNACRLLLHFIDFHDTYQGLNENLGARESNE